MVTPELRGVAVSWSEEQILVRFIYDRPEAEPYIELVQEIEIRVLADFGDAVQTDFAVVPSPAPEAPALLEGEDWVYLRRGTRPAAGRHWWLEEGRNRGDTEGPSHFRGQPRKRGDCDPQYLRRPSMTRLYLRTRLRVTPATRWLTSGGPQVGSLDEAASQTYDDSGLSTELASGRADAALGAEAMAYSAPATHAICAGTDHFFVDSDEQRGRSPLHPV